MDAAEAERSHSHSSRIKAPPLVSWLALAIACAVFSIHTLRRSWTEIHTDFPNYYTAAVLARRGLPLQRYYDSVWFQRQMNYVGWGMQLGGYIPHTPLTLLPVLPLSTLPPMAAAPANAKPD